MFATRLFRIAAAFGIVLLAAPALAQTFDHLACSPLAPRDADADADATDVGRIDIDALEDRFDARHCKLLRARLQCVSRARASLDPAQPLAFVEGDEPADDMTCYRVRCRRAGGRADLVSDAFGTRPIGRLRSHLLCVPAA